MSLFSTENLNGIKIAPIVWLVSIAVLKKVLNMENLPKGKIDTFV